jgi:hypothetical protein
MSIVLAEGDTVGCNRIAISLAAWAGVGRWLSQPKSHRSGTTMTGLMFIACSGLALWFLGLGTRRLAAQDQSPSPDQAAQVPLAFRLKDATPVRLRLRRTLSSASARVGERVDFEVLEEIRVNDVVVMPKGSAAWGTVTEALHRSIAFRGAKLSVSIRAVTLADGETAGLRAVRRFQAEGRAGSMAGEMAVTGLVFFPALPLFLFTPGKNIDIPKGTEITVYVNGDVPLDPKKFAPRAAK